MGGIGLGLNNLNRIPHAHTYAHNTQSHIHISAYHAQQSCTCIEYRIHIYAAPQQYRYTQNAHNMHTHKTQTNIYTCKEYRYTHRNKNKTICSIQNKRTQKQNTTHRTTSAQNNTLVRTVIHTYSFVLIVYNNV